MRLGIMMRTRQQIPLGRHPPDRSAIGWRYDTACRAAQQIMKNGRGFSQLFVDEKGAAAIEFGMVGASGFLGIFGPKQRLFSNALSFGLRDLCDDQGGAIAV